MVKPSMSKKIPQASQTQNAPIKTISLDASKSFDGCNLNKDVSEYKDSAEKSKPKVKRQQNKSAVREGPVVKRVARRSKDANEDAPQVKRKLTRKNKSESLVQDFDLISDDDKNQKEVDIISHSHKAVDDNEKDVNDASEDERPDKQADTKLDEEDDVKNVQHVDLSTNQNKIRSRAVKSKMDVSVVKKKTTVNKQGEQKRNKADIHCEDIGDAEDGKRSDNVKKPKNKSNTAANKKITAKAIQVDEHKKKESGSTGLKQVDSAIQDDNNVRLPSTQSILGEEDSKNHVTKGQRQRRSSKEIDKSARVSVEPVKLKTPARSEMKKKQAVVQEMSVHSGKIPDDTSKEHSAALAVIFRITETEADILMKKYDYDSQRVRDHLIAKQLSRLLDGDALLN